MNHGVITFNVKVSASLYSVAKVSNIAKNEKRSKGVHTAFASALQCSCPRAAKLGPYSYCSIICTSHAIVQNAHTAMPRLRSTVTHGLVIAREPTFQSQTSPYTTAGTLAVLLHVDLAARDRRTAAAQGVLN